MKTKNLLSAAVLGLMVLSPMHPVTNAAEVHEINQVIDLNAMTPEGIYRFIPNYLWIEPGDTVSFLNSVGDHTVTSVKGMWPDGAEMVDIAHQKIASVTLETPGLYVFRCKVHGRHGMYAMVIVGSPESNLDKVEYINIGKRGRGILEGLFEKLKEDMAGRAK